MRLTQTIVKRPVAAIMIIIAIVVFGLSSLIGMPQELTPEMEFPMLVVFTIYQGAGPEDVEKLVTQDLEGSMQSLSGVKRVASYSMENISLIMAVYEYGTNMDIAYTDLKEQLDLRSNFLPDDANSPIVMELDMNAMPAIQLSVSSNNKENLLYFVEEEIAPEFERLSSVAEVNVYGGEEEYIRIELKEDMLAQYGIALSTVSSNVATADFSSPIGSADHGSQSLTVRSEVKYKTVEALGNIPITVGNGATIRLSDVANIYVTTKDSDTLSRYNGSETITLSLQKRQSSSAGKVSKDAQAIMAQIMAADPDIQIDVVWDNSESISSSINSVGQTMILAIVLSMLVLYIFLGDWKASLIVGSSMPVSLLTAFIFMDMMGFTMNIVTMGGLVLGVGMMVDNAIVVLDSCFKSHTKESTFIDAAVEGTQFVMLSVIAGTVTTVVVFLPLATLQGLSGQMFGPLGFTIVFSLLASLISAITLVPLFFTRFQPHERRSAPASILLKKVERSYGKLLRKILRKKKTVFAVTLAFLALSLFLATKLNVELMPATDEGVITVEVDTRPGLKLEYVEELLLDLEEMVASHPDVESYTLQSGGSGASSLMGGGSGSTITAYLYDKRAMDTDDIVEQWRLDTMNIKGCDIDVSSSSSSMSSMSSSGVDFKLEGNDFDNIREAAQMVQDAIAQHPDVIRVSSSIDASNPQAEIVIDPLLAASKGMTPSTITGSVYTALNGSEATKLTIDGQEYSLYVEYPQGRYESISDLANMTLMSPSGKSVPLLDVATIEFSDTPQTITRENNQYIVTVSAVPLQAAKFTLQGELTPVINGMDLPSGVSLGTNTMDQSMNEEFTSLGMAILTAVFLVFMVMAIQFESVKHSIMVMICIPFSLIGSFSLLWLSGSTISMVSLLGFLVLVGTVVNNGILFVDTANQYRKSMDLETALVMTGRTRLRPILMTTLTTVLSMIPLAIGWGSGTESMTGMGVTVIGGLTASTLLTLLMLPTFYLIIDGNPEKKKKREEKRRIREEKRRMKAEARETKRPVQ